MSINRNMKSYSLQRNVPKRSTSGANKDNWMDIGPVKVAVTLKNDIKVNGTEKYLESTHTGLTHHRGIDTDCRLLEGDVIYEITSCNTGGRLTNLLLKVVV